MIASTVIRDCELFLGDAREILPLLPPIESLVTDPPYGMAFRSNQRAERWDGIVGDADAELLKWACGLPASHSKYVFCRWDNVAVLPKPKSLITWVKNSWSMGDLDHEHARQTEVACFYPGPRHFFPLGRPTDVVDARRTGNDSHPTEKPVYLLEQIVRHTFGLVTDCFMGSGTTGVACANLGRKFIGIEIEPKYFDIACRRIDAAYKQPRLFTEPTPKPVQEAML